MMLRPALRPPLRAPSPGALALNEGVGGLAPAGYAGLLYKDGAGTYRQLRYKDANGVYRPLAYKVA